MIRYATFLSRCLAFILTLTFVAPSFAWDATEGVWLHDDVAVNHDAMSLAAVSEVADPCSHPDCHDHEVFDVAMQASPEEPCPDSHHHCCPGHQLGHLQGAVLTLGLGYFLAEGNHFPAMLRETLFRTRIPAGLERPPRFSVA